MQREVISRIRQQLDSARTSHIYRDYSNALKLISQVVFTRSSGFILEFLQNAEDSGFGLEHTSGIFRISIDEHCLTVMHNGRPFTDADVEALCGIRSSKRPDKGTLGYLGIGFKSVFKVSDRPEIYSGGFKFKFEKSEESTDSLWQVMPLWSDAPSVTVNPEFTTFIVPFRDPASYTALVSDLMRLGPQVYLFLRWTKQIEILDRGSGVTRTLENLGIDEQGITTIREDDREQQFLIFRAEVDVPEDVRADALTRDYRAGVQRREIAIAFALDRTGRLSPSEAMASYGGVYSFMPLSESKSGAPFSIQADFLVQPGRDAINYEARWNHWLVQEVAELCKKAIRTFVAHPSRCYEFLPLFSFSHSHTSEGYEKFFGPYLINPVEQYINTQACVPTALGSFAPLPMLVRLTEAPSAVEDLVNQRILVQDEMASAMGGGPDTVLVHTQVVIPNNRPIPTVDRSGLLANEDFLRKKADTAGAPDWFRRLYQWLRRYPVYEQTRRGRTRQIRTYHYADFVLTADGVLLPGRKVSLVDDLPPSNHLLIELAKHWQKDRPLLHPEILGSAESNEQKDIRGFLIGMTGVQQIGAATLCRQTVVPKISTDAPRPTVDDILLYTRCCKDALGSDLHSLPEFWVLTKEGEVRAAREVFFGSDFKPQTDWEKHRQFVPGLNFLSAKYLINPKNEDLQSWRALLSAGGIKRDPDNGVEVFAIHYAEEQLRPRYASLHRIEEHNLGYDLEAKTSTGESLQIEVKGRQKEEDIELTPNETKAAHKNQDTYYLCVVASIPEHPTMYLVQNPDRVGLKHKLTIPSAIWREWRLS